MAMKYEDTMFVKTTIRALLKERGGRLSDKVFLLFEDRTYTYADLLSRSREVASILTTAGVKKGDRVSIIFENSPEYIFCFFGIASIGAVMVPVNVNYKPDEIDYVVSHSEAKTVIFSERYVQAIDALRQRWSPDMCYVISSANDGANAPKWAVPFRTSLPLEASKLEQNEIAPEDMAVIIYTSGTTGKPKGVMLSHWNLVLNARQMVERKEITSNDRFLCTLPLFHVNSLVTVLLCLLEAGGSVALLPGFSPSKFLPAIQKYKATAFAAVPTIYAILMNIPDRDKYDFSSLRIVSCGAAPMAVDLFKAVEQAYKVFILEGYGLTEGTCGSSGNPIGKRKIGSLGIPLRGTGMKIVDENGKDLPPGKTGEIVHSGETTMKGYFKDPEATAACIVNGWLHTGDLGYMDEEGYFYIAGRIKEMIIRGGVNIYPREVEEVLLKHPAVLDAAVVGIADVIWGERVHACIVRREGATADEAEFTKYLKERLADFKVPSKITFHSEFPRTATGKVRKGEIRKSLQGAKT
jgi:long-chain acyl-CoA synthetase